MQKRKYTAINVNLKLLQLAFDPEEFPLVSKSSFINKLLIEHLEKKGFKKAELIEIFKNGE